MRGPSRGLVYRVNVLRSLSIWQVHKVRFVASTLLDAVRKAETAPASAARAHAYLCKPPLRVGPA